MRAQLMKKRERSGFGFVELLVVVLLAGILAGAAMLAIGGGTQKTGEARIRIAVLSLGSPGFKMPAPDMAAIDPDTISSDMQPKALVVFVPGRASSSM